MTFTDRYGLALTTSSAAAADAYTRGLDHALAAEAPAEACFRQAREEDPGFALAHVAEARMLQFRGRAKEAAAALEQGRAAAASASPREQSHVACFATAISGNPAGALEAVRAHLADYPRDAFVLSQACGVYGLIGFSGRLDRNEEQLALLEPLAPVYGDDWWFLSQIAFAYNELFRHEEARRAIERSLQGNPRNGHASHTVAHIEYETGQADAGAHFMREWLVGYDRANQLYVHNSWHLALFELAAGNYEAVMDLYDRAIRPEVASSPPLGTVADAAALLWRCNLTERPASDLPWEPLADWSRQVFQQPGMTWADAHCMIAWAAVNDQARLGQLIDQLKQRVAAGKVYAGAMLPTLGEAFQAFAADDWERSASLFDSVADEVIRLGGSHAQRDVFEESRIEAHARAGHLETARAILEERLDRRANGRDARWLEHINARYEGAAAAG
ncbi:MAG: tetratricopeptide repeat protein [Dehalococcoidia bacterium]|nr:tetratricopeptide repeat protein [Dehalococcoidia bacterium]